MQKATFRSLQTLHWRRYDIGSSSLCALWKKILSTCSHSQNVYLNYDVGHPSKTKRHNNVILMWHRREVERRWYDVLCLPSRFKMPFSQLNESVAAVTLYLKLNDVNSKANKWWFYIAMVNFTMKTSELVRNKVKTVFQSQIHDKNIDQSNDGEN